jgi:hypothetical protein
MAMSTNHVALAREGAVYTITLDRPELRPDGLKAMRETGMTSLEMNYG